MKKKVIALLCLFVVTFASLFVANNIQTVNGDVKVTIDSFDMHYTDINGNDALGTVVFKLYVPNTATSEHKAPGLLMLHGYQNDHETDAAYAIEMARRGAVVMCIDEFGHGATDISMINRGYVNHKVTVNYGNDSEDEGTFVSIKGQTRYKVLMNFSNLSFFKDKYSKDNDGNVLYDSSMGGIAAYALLSQWDNVDNTKMAISGHSMGTWASWSTAAAYSGSAIEPQATILQAGELFSKEAYDADKIKFNNVLLLTAKYDEFNYFRDYSKKTVDDDVIKNAITSEFLGVDSGKGEWNKTYGDFSNGTARRRQLVNTNHRLLTHNSLALAASTDWLTNAIGLNSDLSSDDQIFMKKEVLVLIATLSAIASMMVLMNILLDTKLFAYLNKPELNTIRKTKIGWAYWKGAIITILIAFITYPFLTQLGHGLLPLPDTTIFRMTIGNGFLSWYLVLIIIMLVTTIISFVKAKKNNQELSYVDLGLSTVEHKNSIDFKLLAKGLLLAICLASYMYIQCFLAEKSFLIRFPIYLAIL